VRNLSSAALIALVVPAAGHADNGPPLRYMFHLSPSKQAANGPRFVCPSLIVPLTDMSDMKKTIYAPGATQSVVDKAKERAYVERTKAAAQEKKILTSLVRAAATDPADHERIADCILRHIGNWAEANALLQNLDKNNPATHRQAIVTDILTVITFANAYQAASDIAGVPQARKELIGRWFRRLSDEIVKEFTPPAQPRQKNFQWLDGNSNHRYWAAAAVGVMAVHLQDRQRFDWSMNVLRSALAEADSDGSLRRELQRGDKSLRYQNYAMQPLAILVRLADANGVKLTSEEEAKLSAIARFAAESYENPEPLEKRVGAEQEKRPDMISWIGPLKDHFDRSNPQLSRYLAQLAASNKVGFDRACSVTCVTMLAELQAQKN
jgi:hypothetical protein